MMRALASITGIVAILTLVAVAQSPSTPSIGPKPGSSAPAFSGQDQFGRTRTLQSLMARDGLMLVFFRSADW